MNFSFSAITDTILDHTSTEWIEALVVALLLALVLGGAFAALRRWLHVKDEAAPLVGLGVIAIFAGMVVASVYVHMNLKHKYSVAREAEERRNPAGMGGGGGGANRGGGGPGGGGGGGQQSTRLAGMILEDADADHDGKLTTEEAGIAAANFIRNASKDGKESIDRDALVAVLREKMRPPGGGGGGGGGGGNPGGPPQRKAEASAKTEPPASKAEEPAPAPASTPKNEEPSKPAP